MAEPGEAASQGLDAAFARAHNEGTGAWRADGHICLGGLRSVLQEETMPIGFTVNGTATSTDAPPATPLLWVIREGLKLTGTKFGCGTGLCGACMVHIDGKRAFSCQTQVSEIAGRSVTTIEGLSADASHPLQKAWLAEHVPQCGYCQSGQIMSAADLLRQNSRPTRDEIVAHMSTNICRCGTYQRIVRAVERAAREA
jgi:isoquinoline 1-oxidoreductase subunit alpha